MLMRSEDLVILEPGNDRDNDIDVEVDELFENENIEHENEVIPSEIFTQKDWDIVDFVCEPGPHWQIRIYICRQFLFNSIKKYYVT